MREDFKSTARELADFSLPLIASGVLQQLYNWADAFIVGNVVGEAALAAVGATATAVGFYIYLIAGFSVGLSILFAQTYGSGDMRAMPRILSTFSAVFLAAFSAFAAFGMVTAPALLRLLRPLGAHPANLCQAVLFAALHGTLTEKCYALGMGLIFGWAAEQTDSPAPGVVLHILNNGLVLARALAERGMG